MTRLQQRLHRHRQRQEQRQRIKAEIKNTALGMAMALLAVRDFLVFLLANAPGFEDRNYRLTRLEQRLRLHRRMQARKERVKTRLLLETKRAAALAVIFAMLFSIIKMPVTYAYLTAGPVYSETMTLRITEDTPTENAAAAVVFQEAFLMEDEASLELQQQAVENRTMLPVLHGQADDSLTLQEAPGNREEPADTGTLQTTGTARENLLYTEIELEAGFHAADIFLPSVELRHGNRTTGVLSGAMTAEDRLLLAFDRAEIAGWFAGTPGESEEVSFTVAGEGYVQGLDLFRFSGQAALPVRGSYEIVIIKVSGPDTLYVPAEDAATYRVGYTLLDQDDNTVDFARNSVTGLDWELNAAPDGVTFDPQDAELTVSGEAGPGQVVLQASLRVQERFGERFLVAEKVIELLPAPEMEILGAEKMLIPLPGDSLQAEYTLRSADSLELEEIEWSLPQDPPGVQLQDGTLTVSGQAAAGHVTLQVSARFQEISLSAAKQVLLETVPVGTVRISGPAGLQIPAAGQEALHTPYRAEVFDTTGGSLPGEPVAWKLETPAEGLELSPDGMLSVTAEARPGEVSIAAVSLRNPTVQALINVQLQAPAVPEEEERPRERENEEKQEEENKDPAEDREATPEPGEDKDQDQDSDPGGGGGTEQPDPAEPAMHIEGPALILLPREADAPPGNGGENGPEANNGETAAEEAAAEEALQEEETDAETPGEKDEDNGGSEDEKAKSTVVAYSALDSDGLRLESVTWSILEGPEGVSVDQEGNLLIKHGEVLLPAEVILQAAGEEGGDQGQQEPAYSVRKTIALDYAVPSALHIFGPLKLTLPAADLEPGADPPEGPAGKEHLFEAQVLDQLGQLLEGEEVRWELAAEISGVSLDSTTGLLTVAAGAPAGEITILAFSLSDESLSASFTVLLREPAQDEEPAEGADGADPAEDEDGTDPGAEDSADPGDLPEAKEEDELPEGKEDDEDDEDDKEDEEGIDEPLPGTEDNGAQEEGPDETGEPQETDEPDENNDDNNDIEIVDAAGDNEDYAPGDEMAPGEEPMGDGGDEEEGDGAPAESDDQGGAEDAAADGTTGQEEHTLNPLSGEEAVVERKDDEDAADA